MKEGNVAVNLSIDQSIAQAVREFVVGHQRKGCNNLSELTEQLWISHLRKKKAKLPPLTKTAVRKNTSPKRKLSAVAA